MIGSVIGGSSYRGKSLSSGNLQQSKSLYEPRQMAHYRYGGAPTSSTNGTPQMTYMYTWRLLAPVSGVYVAVGKKELAP